MFVTGQQCHLSTGGDVRVRRHHVVSLSCVVSGFKVLIWLFEGVITFSHSNSCCPSNVYLPKKYVFGAEVKVSNERSFVTSYLQLIVDKYLSSAVENGTKN